MRGGIFSLILEIVKSTPAIVEFLILSLIVFLIMRLVKKSYSDFFDRELVKGVKIKKLTPIAIIILGTVYYCILAKESFFLALGDGLMMSVIGIIYDNLWEVIKNLIKSISTKGGK